jgi:hypothetical protein
MASENEFKDFIDRTQVHPAKINESGSYFIEGRHGRAFHLVLNRFINK